MKNGDPRGHVTDVRSSIEQAKELARDLRAKLYQHLYGSRLPVALNTDKFARYVGAETGVQIEKALSSELGEHLLGMLYRKSNSEAVVLISDKNNECWRRFVFVKEIAHFFLDDEARYSNDAESIAIALLSDSGVAKLQYESEIAATVAAIEIMIPDHLNEWVAHEANVKQKTPFQIAFGLKAPRKYVEYRMREWGGIQIHPEEISK